MTEEEGGGDSARMVTPDNNSGHGGHHQSSCHWRLEVVLPSTTLLPSCNKGGLRGTQKPVVSSGNAIADAVAPARYTMAGVVASCGRKTKAKAEPEMTTMMMTATTMTTTTMMTKMTTMTTTTTTTQMARRMPAPAISCRQGGFKNQQGGEAATE